MKKLFLLFILLVGMVTTPSTKVSAESILTRPSDASMNKNFENTELATKIYRKLFASNSRAVPYDLSEYSGIYLDENDELVIGLSSRYIVEGDTLRNKYDSYLLDLPEAKGRYRYEMKRYNLNYLLSIKSQLEQVYEVGITAISVSQKENAVIVKVKDDDVAQFVFEYLKSSIENFQENMVQVYVGDSIQLLGRKAYPGQKISDRVKFLIFFWQTKMTGTIGFNAIRNGVKGIVTCEHVAPLNHTIFDKDNVLIGNTVAAEFNGLVDAAFVAFSDQNAWDTTNEIIHSSTSTMYLKFTATVVEGSSVMSYGMTTNYTYGTVLSLYYSGLAQRADGSTMLFTDMIAHTCAIAPGDSGGPLIKYYPRSTSYGLVGMNSGATEEHAVAVKIDHIINALNVSVVFE